jgi:hypothetical protein
LPSIRHFVTPSSRNGRKAVVQLAHQPFFL